MDHKKLTLKKIENPSTRQSAYSKRKDSILRKARELSILCDVDVAVMMFSPSGRLNSFASSGRLEDIFIRYLGQPEESEEGPLTHAKYLAQRLRHLKYEEQVLEKMAIIEALEEKLAKLTENRQRAKDKLRFYEPNVEAMNSVLVAGIYEDYLTNALKNIRSAKAKLLGKKIMPQTSENAEVAAVEMEIDASASVANELADLYQMRSPLMEEPDEETPQPRGPHLTLSFIEAQKNWIMYGKQTLKP